MLVLIGVVFLAINLGKLSWWIWADLLHLWPVLLIAIGLEIIVKKSKLQFLGYISSLLIIGTFAWAIMDNGGFAARGDYGIFPSSRSEAIVDYKSEVSASVKLRFDSGRLYFNSGDTDLLRAVAENSRRGISVNSDYSLPRCLITLSPTAGSGSAIRRFGSDESHWKCYVHPDVSVNYDLKVTDADLRFFGQTLKVDTLRIQADHSDLLIKLGNRQPRTWLDVSAQDADLDLYLPDSVGIRFDGSYPSAEEATALKLTDRGGYMANDLYDQAAVSFSIKSDLKNGKVRISSY
jgi:hypothetical protein